MNRITCIMKIFHIFHFKCASIAKVHAQRVVCFGRFIPFSEHRKLCKFNYFEWREWNFIALSTKYNQNKIVIPRTTVGRPPPCSRLENAFGQCKHLHIVFGKHKSSEFAIGIFVFNVQILWKIQLIQRKTWYIERIPYTRTQAHTMGLFERRHSEQLSWASFIAYFMVETKIFGCPIKKKREHWIELHCVYGLCVHSVNEDEHPVSMVMVVFHFIFVFNEPLSNLKYFSHLCTLLLKLKQKHASLHLICDFENAHNFTNGTTRWSIWFASIVWSWIEFKFGERTDWSWIRRKDANLTDFN